VAAPLRPSAARAGLLALALALGCAARAPAPEAEVQVEERLLERAVHDGRGPRTVTRLSDTADQTIELSQVVGRLALHRHVHSQETILVLSGKGELDLAGGTREVDPGDLVVVPPDTPHGFTPCDGQAVLLSIFAPPLRAGDQVLEPTPVLGER
jgi:mannose-6-phosphate isomerase-like protein (cupin superfamily)